MEVLDGFFLDKFYQPLADKIHDLTGLNNFSLARGLLHFVGFIFLFFSAMTLSVGMVGLFIYMIAVATLNSFLIVVTNYLENLSSNSNGAVLPRHGIWADIRALLLIQTLANLVLNTLLGLLPIFEALFLLEISAFYFIVCLPRPRAKGRAREKLKQFLSTIQIPRVQPVGT